MENENLEVLKTVRDEYTKIREKYQKKATKEHEKINDIFVTICGVKCYTEDEINEMYAADYITCGQSDRYIEKLNKKKEKAGQLADHQTKSERICTIINNTISNLDIEINDMIHLQQEEEKKLERWEIAQAQGCSYQEFLDLEEVSRQSAEYELLMGFH